MADDLLRPDEQKAMRIVTDGPTTEAILLLADRLREARQQLHKIAVRRLMEITDRTEEEAETDVAAIEEGLKAFAEGRVRPWETVRKERGL